MNPILFKVLHYIFVEMLQLLLGLVLLFNTVKTLSLGDCDSTHQDCGYAYILDNDNYSEDIKPIHYLIICSVILMFPLISGLLYVSINTHTHGEYFSKVMKFKRSKFWKYTSYIIPGIILLLGAYGFFSSAGGLPHQDPIGYWSILLVCIKEIRGSVHIPKYKLIDLNDKDVHEIQWKLGSIKDIATQKKFEAFEMDIVAAKLVRSKEYVNKVLNKEENPDKLDEVDIVKIDDNNKASNIVP